MTHDVEAIAKLIERVEAAEGPDRELDAQIAAAAREGASEWAWAARYPDWVATADGRVHLEKNGPSFSAPAYTASLDAAMSLVPEGAKAATVNWCPYGSGVAEVYLGNPTPMFNSEAATPALALCAASLRARTTTPKIGG